MDHQVTTVQLTDTQLAQFTACGVIVVDGLCPLCIEAGSGHDYMGPCRDWLPLPQWAELTEPCPTCGGDGLLSNESGDPHCWYCSGEACALCYRAMQTRECDHDLIARHGDDGCRDECPDCDRGRQVVTLTATCPTCGEAHKTTPGSCKCRDCDLTGVVTLGRFTIRLLPVVETVPAVASSDPIEGPTVAFTDSQFPRELFIRHDGVIDSLGYPGPLPQPGQWCVQFDRDHQETKDKT